MSNEGELEDYRWLVSEAARLWLDEAAQAEGDVVALAGRLRRHLTSQRTHLVLQQVELRRKARAKFSHADEYFYTPRALEQATDQVVAEYKARRFPAGTPVVDLCCGIGGDLMALLSSCKATGVDRDPIVALLAEANCRQQATDIRADLLQPADSWPAVFVRCREVDEACVAESSAWHIDPDRRPAGRRTTRVELHEPGPELIEKLLAVQPNAAIKLAPAAELPPSWNERAELEWISRDRQCRQLVAWFGDLAHEAGTSSATILGKPQTPVYTVSGQPHQDLAVSSAVRRYVYEPDPAVLAAGLTGALAGQYDIQAIGCGIAYLTGDERVVCTAMSCFAVQEVLPFQPKRLKALLRTRGIGQLEVKKRGVPYDPQTVRRQLAVPGEHSATLLLTRVNNVVTAILGQRVEERVG